MVQDQSNSGSASAQSGGDCDKCCGKHRGIVDAVQREELNLGRRARRGPIIEADFECRRRNRGRDWSPVGVHVRVFEHAGVNRTMLVDSRVFSLYVVNLSVICLIALKLNLPFGD